MLWTAIHLSQLSLDCTPQAPDCAFAVVEKRRIVAASPAARSSGVRTGQSLTAALALVPALAWAERSVEREAAALETLCLWSLQFTSGVALAAQGLILETGGSAKLFGGLPALLARIGEGLAGQGFAATLASAPTPTGARMLARSGFASHLETLSDLHAALPRLPAGALDSAAGFAATFDTLGLKSVADVLALPRDGLTRRFGPLLVDELDRALGHRPDPLRTIVVPQTFHSSIALPAPVESTEAIGFACRRAFDQLEGFLRAGKRAVERIELELHHERGAGCAGNAAQPEQRIRLDFFEPAASSERFMLILSERLNHVALEARVERIALSAPAFSTAAESTRTLLPEPARAGRGLAQLLERLNARLGAECISGVASAADHRPARASTLQTIDMKAVSAAHRAARAGDAPAPVFGPRPVWLVEPPRPLKEVGGKPHHDGPLTLMAGPERIESGWWDGAAMTRDYFIARTQERALVWIFRERDLPTGWFLQGYFG